MTTALQLTPSERPSIDPEIMEKVIVGGDLSKLNPSQRLHFYMARCDAAGLDPRAQPFLYLSLQGKLILYATKAATDQLINSRALTVEIVERTHHVELGIYEVRCRVTLPSGRHVEDMAALPIAGLKGEALCNSIMKCCTKSKRRTVLSACGLGLLDESEVETIPDARRVGMDEVHEPHEPSDSHHARHHKNDTGYGAGAYAAPHVVAEYRRWRDEFVREKNEHWRDHCTDAQGEVTPGAPDELLRTFQVSGHLVKWGVGQRVLNAPENPRPAQTDRLAAVLWERHREEMLAEANGYARRCWRAAAAQLAADRPEEESQERDIDDDDVPDEAFGRHEREAGEEG